MKKSYSMFGLFFMIVFALVTIALGFSVFGMDNPIPWVVLVALALVPYLHERKIRKEYIDWGAQYEVGIELIDHDHQKLVGLLNQVVSAANFHMGESYVRSVIGELIDYTKYHFEREENLMKENNYPDLEAHLQQHKIMIDRVEQFRAEFETKPDCDEDICMDVYRYLKSWLVNHITHTDMELGRYLKSQGVK